MRHLAAASWPAAACPDSSSAVTAGEKRAAKAAPVAIAAVMLSALASARKCFLGRPQAKYHAICMVFHRAAIMSPVVTLASPYVSLSPIFIGINENGCAVYVESNVHRGALQRAAFSRCASIPARVISLSYLWPKLPRHRRHHVSNYVPRNDNDEALALCERENWCIVLRPLLCAPTEERLVGRVKAAWVALRRGK